MIPSQENRLAPPTSHAGDFSRGGRRPNWVLRWWTYLGVALLFLPKVNFIPLSGFRAGIRIDDFVIAFSVMYVIGTGLVLPMFRSKVFLWGIAFVGVSFLSNIFGGSLLFSLRMLEYLCILFIAFAYRRIAAENALAKLLYAYLIVNWILCVLQAYGIAGGIGMEGFTHDFDGRCFGLCNGPWELGIVTCFLFAYLSTCNWVRARRFRLAIIHVSALTILVLTAARTPIAIFSFLCLMEATRSIPGGMRMVARIAVPVLAFVVLYVAVWSIDTDNFAVIRLRSFMNGDNFRELVEFCETYKPSRHNWEIPDGEFVRYQNADLDASMAMRFYIFDYIFGNYILGGPATWVLGLGHGFAGPSTDLGLLRILCETGVLGFLCYHMMLWKAFQLTSGIRLMIVCFMINQLTLDVYVGYKTMFVFFLIVGYELGAVLLPKRRVHLPPILNGRAQAALSVQHA